MRDTLAPGRQTENPITITSCCINRPQPFQCRHFMHILSIVLMLQEGMHGARSVFKLWVKSSQDIHRANNTKVFIGQIARANRQMNTLVLLEFTLCQVSITNVQK